MVASPTASHTNRSEAIMKITVSIAQTGEKYHRDACSSLKRSRFAVREAFAWFDALSAKNRADKSTV